ncbi:MAG: HNH endonuclease, partial [Gammaproteobacteria bacterium]|nr:HNH endonuclease [Gammaproteobacteria bacterium]
MRLHAVPYTPNYAEWLILRNRNILADQMAFLKAQCPKERRDYL